MNHILMRVLEKNKRRKNARGVGNCISAAVRAVLPVPPVNGKITNDVKSQSNSVGVRQLQNFVSRILKLMHKTHSDQPKIIVFLHQRYQPESLE